MALRQQFYSLTHDPAVSIAVFIDAVFSIVRQLGAIGHKPDDLEVSDKLLIGLHQSWAPVRTALTLRERSAKPEIEKITSALKQFEANESLVAAPGPQIKAEASERSLAESVLYAKSRGGGSKGSKGHKRYSEEYDWGNTKEREGVCWRCGRENHMAKNCVANMPEDIKRKIVDHANIAITSPDGAIPEELFAFASEGHNNPLCESVTYGSGKQGKLKLGWEEEFAWG